MRPDGTKAEGARAFRVLGRTIVGVFVVSLVLRVVWVMHTTITPISDFAGYDDAAWNWARSGEFSHRGGAAYRTPGYPAFLAACYAVFGHSWKAAGLLQALLGATSSGLLVVLAARIVSVRTAAIAGLLHALSPTALAYVPALASENLVTPVLIAGLILLCRSSGSSWRAWLAALGSGCFFGLLLLVRPAALFLTPAWLILAFFRPKRHDRRVVCGLITLAGIFCVLSPWLARNHLRGLGFATLSTTGGANLWMGNNPGARDGGYLRAALYAPNLDERNRDREYMRSALRWIREKPRRYLALCRVRALRLLGFRGDHNAARYLSVAPENDAARLAYHAKLRGKAADPELAAAGERLTAHGKLQLERLRRISAPLTLVAVALALARWRAFSIVLLPALCYGLGLSATFFEERFRELLNPLLFVPLAGLLSDSLLGTSDLGARPARLVKSVVVLAAIGAGVLIGGFNVDHGWYRLERIVAPRYAPFPHVSQSRLSPVRLSEPAGRYKSHWIDGSSDVTIERIGDGLHSAIQANSDSEGGHYGGIKFPVRGGGPMRLELSFDDPAVINNIYVFGYGERKRKAYVWRWRVDDRSLPRRGRAVYTFVPGKPSGYFTYHEESTPPEVKEIHVVIRVERNATTGFTLHSAEVQD